MKRRDFLKALTGFAIGAGCAQRALADAVRFPYARGGREGHGHLQGYLHRMRFFNRPHVGDVYIEAERKALLETVSARLDRLERTVGHGRFNLLHLDDALIVARDYRRVGEFPKKELAFLEEMFYRDARVYGFLDSKTLAKITDRVFDQDVVKVSHSGHYLYKGRPLETFEKIKKDVGDQAILTSGVRGVMKQFALFFRRAVEHQGNLSLASRSLAPPGYSFHGISDFDVGQVGFGADNFTEHFVTTEVCMKLSDLRYISLRYPRGNPLGVRFEPWHIRVSQG